MMEAYLNAESLLAGSGQGFERDVARLMVCNGFDEVRTISSNGWGGDILATKNAKVWLVRCVATSIIGAAAKVVDDLVEVARYQVADLIFLATDRPVSPTLAEALKRWRALGIEVGLLEPAVLLSLATRSPEYSLRRKNLRTYQAKSVELFVESLSQTRRAQVVLATGLGKTVVLAESAAQLYRDGALLSGRTLVLAGTRELVDQLQRAFWMQLPKWVPTHRLMGGERPTAWSGITFATVQSAVAQIESLPSFDLVLIDEAHHLGSDSLLALIESFSAAMIGGATATPWRGDGFDLDDILGEPVVRMGIAEGMSKGFLCKADYRLMADNVDWPAVRRHSLHQYSLGHLNKLLFLPLRDEEAARTIRSIFDEERRKSVIVFCASVRHAISFAASLRLFGFKADPIVGSMTPGERERVLRDFKRSYVEVITTRDLFNEGVDVPDVDMIVFMRVTHSRRIFVQQLGRGLRTSKGKKKVVVVDFVSDLRRIAEVIDLERASNHGLERLAPPGSIRFENSPLGAGLLRWMTEQADLFSREGDPLLELPDFSEGSQE